MKNNKNLPLLSTMSTIKRVFSAICNSRTLMLRLCISSLHLFFISLFLFLTACASKHKSQTISLAKLESTLETCGYAKVIRRGQFLRVVLYKDLFFEPNTTKIKECRFKDLDLIAQILIVMGNDRGILITGHSDSIKSERDRLKESDIIARNIAAYLWARGVPYERIKVFGLSDKKLIAAEDTPFGSGYNRRVEILVPYDNLNPC